MSANPSDAENMAAWEIISRRVFSAGPNVLWEAFRDPDRLSRWWGPAGFTNEFHEFDFRPGGTWRFTMHGPDGAQYPMKKQFVEIAAPEKIVLDHIDPIHGFRMFMRFGDRNGKTEIAWRMLFDSAEEATRVRPFVLAANEENFDRLAALVTEGKRP